MIRVIRTQHSVLLAGAVMGFALLGDSLLYAVLPLHASDLGIPLVFVGVILSINRWIRLISNHLAVKVYRVIGLYRAMLSACVITVLTILIYAYPASLFLLLGARIVWGVCWSHLRLGGHLIVIHTARKKLGLAMGSMNAVSRAGSAFALLAGGALVDNLGYSKGLTGMALLSAFCIPMVFILRSQLHRGGHVIAVEPAQSKIDAFREEKIEADTRPTVRRRYVYLCYAAAFINSFVIRGVVMASIALLLQQRLTVDVRLWGMVIGIATISGMLLASRWVSTILVSPALGHLSDRRDRQPILLITLAVETAALLVIGLTMSPLWTILAALFTFTAGGAVETVIHAAVAETTRSGNAAARMSAYATFDDMGAASGPLAGYVLASLIGFAVIYVLGGAAVLTLAVLFLKTSVYPPGREKARRRRK